MLDECFKIDYSMKNLSSVRSPRMLWIVITSLNYKLFNEESYLGLSEGFIAYNFAWMDMRVEPGSIWLWRHNLENCVQLLYLGKLLLPLEKHPRFHHYLKLKTKKHFKPYGNVGKKFNLLSVLNRNATIIVVLNRSITVRTFQFRLEVQFGYFPHNITV